MRVDLEDFFDPESTAEMERLIGQGRMMTNAMGGPLTGLPNLPPGARIVDLACGTGGWAVDAASTSPDSEIVGWISEEFEQSYQQMLIDMNQPGFCAIFTFVSVIGTRAA